jgi:hypothetical protein
MGARGRGSRLDPAVLVECRRRCQDLGIHHRTLSSDQSFPQGGDTSPRVAAAHPGSAGSTTPYHRSPSQLTECEIQQNPGSPRAHPGCAGSDASVGSWMPCGVRGKEISWNISLVVAHAVLPGVRCATPGFDARRLRRADRRTQVVLQLRGSWREGPNQVWSFPRIGVDGNRPVLGSISKEGESGTLAHGGLTFVPQFQI